MAFVGFKLATLLAFLGGPLLVAQELEGKLRAPFPFVVGFLPVGLLALGFLTLREKSPTALDRLSLRLGVIAATSLFALDLYALGRLAKGAEGRDRSLIFVGTLVGLAVSSVYLRIVRKTRKY